MNIDNSVLKNDEIAIFKLRSLYRKYGYSQYKMNKFEEYDLYVRNKDFLVSDNIITFNDKDGKLMALRPDVTLSIIKNGKDKCGVLEKVYYNENVYRAPRGKLSFCEIMQVGLECIGDIDEYCTYEVIILAAKSLESIGKRFVLDISHLGLISKLVSGMGLGVTPEKEIIKCISEKNIYGIRAVCENEGVIGEGLERLIKLASTYGKISDVLPVLCELFEKDDEDANEFISLCRALSGTEFSDSIRVDFSVINDMNYYGGIVFRGFVDGIPEGILSGGRYDKLMEKMGRRSGAIGFAVYLDMLERLSGDIAEYDVDAVILYDEDVEIEKLTSAIRLISDGGKSVAAQKAVPENLKYRQLLRVDGKGVEIIENNA